MARRKIRVVGIAAGTSLRPLLVESFKDVAITHSGGRDVTETRVFEAILSVAWRNRYFRSCVFQPSVIDRETFYNDGWRRMVFAQICWVNDSDTLTSCEPEMPINRPPGAGMPAGGHLVGWHSIGGAIGGDVRGTRRCFSAGDEFGRQDAHDSTT